MISIYHPFQLLKTGTSLLSSWLLFSLMIYRASILANNLKAPGTPAGSSLNQLIPE